MGEIDYTYGCCIGFGGHKPSIHFVAEHDQEVVISRFRT
jgi:hypothetical protein